MGSYHMFLQTLMIKSVFAVSSVFTGLVGMIMAQDALDPSADILTRATEGGSSVVLLAIAASSMYALIQGRIVPISAFNDRLKAIEQKLVENGNSAEKSLVAITAIASEIKEVQESVRRVEQAISSMNARGK